MATMVYFDPRCEKKDLAQRRVMLYHSMLDNHTDYKEITRQLGNSQDTRVFYTNGEVIVLKMKAPSVIISENPQMARSLLSDLEELAEIKLKEFGL